MIENVKFYLISALIALFISICLQGVGRRETKFLWLVLIVPVFWILSASNFIVYKEKGKTGFFEAIPLSIDARYFMASEFGRTGMQRDLAMRPPGVLAMFSISFFVLLFRWLLVLKRKD